MRLVFDFETYFDDAYSLKKLHTLEYVRDDRFQVHGVACKLDDNKTEWLTDDEFRLFLAGLRNKPVEIIAHNTYFDGLILFHHYSYVPTQYCDTLSMARALLPHAPSHDLDYLCQALNIGSKISEVLGLTKGKRSLTPTEFEALGEYAKNDVELALGLFQVLSPALPDDEAKLIDLTLRWGCRPVLHVDLPRAKLALTNASEQRNAKIKASGQSLAVLSSQDKFLALLQSLSIDVPTKLNSKGKAIPALAKNDLGFRQMMANYPEHRALFEGRLAAKSTIDVTRIKRVIGIGTNGTLPMPLKYYGAHTGRWSGADGLNPQNFRRGSELRKSIIAPPGYVILVADLKQIEARMNMWFCNELGWLQIFRDGIDIYSALAADHYNVALSEVTPTQRFFGKTLELGLGYQMGWKKFRNTCALREIYLSVEESYQTVMHYRRTHTNIALKWAQLGNHLNGMYQTDYSFVDGPVTYVHEGVLLPNNMRLDYANLTPHENGNWSYGYGAKQKHIYGGKMLENIIQALARVVLGEQLLKIEAAGITTVSSTHDEPIMVVREKEAEEAKQTVEQIMSCPPSWAPKLPVAVDVGFAREYSK